MDIETRVGAGVQAGGPWSPWGGEYLRTPDRYIWGTRASRLARETAALLGRRARVLDLGCGEGRDSVFFAAHGFAVTGVELSAAGLRKARRLAAARHVRVRWVCSALPRLPVTGPFELVYSCGSIHYVAAAARATFFARLHALTAPGGYHAHVVFTDRHVHEEKGERIDYFAPGELARAFVGWDVLRYEGGLIGCAQDGTSHAHSIELILAHRPTVASQQRASAS